MIRRKRTALAALFAGLVMAQGVMGDDILKTVGFDTCEQDAQVSVQKADITYNNADKTVTFDVVGTSNQVQNVTAHLTVTAYGANIYENKFNPCDAGTFVKQLCPVPAGTFSAKGTQKIPAEFADMVPSIAFQIPDIAAMAKLELLSESTGKNVACIQSEVTNGKTASVPAVSYVAAGVAGAALILTGISAAGAAVAGGSAAAGGAGGAASSAGMGTISPSFTEVFGFFQGMAMNGMLSVNYPPVYRNFAKNFGFSTGVIPWAAMQTSIDDFRGKTGGNLTHNSFSFLREHATLVFPDNSTMTLHENNGSLPVKRAINEFIRLATREIETSVNLTDPSAATTESGNGTTESFRVAVKGITQYVQQLSIPSANMFMTILLIVAIIIAAIVVGILLVKVVLELWALYGSFPAKLAGFRKHYWMSIARAITSLIMLLYGVWVLYCVFQFTQGDSWAAKVLAGVTLALFTGVLAFFSYKIWSTARKLKKLEGNVGGLYEDKKIWVRYSLFYESYRRDYWWIFVPTILYMFSRSMVLAAADGHGMVQTIAQLSIEGLMLILLIWSRPYERRSGNVINIMIQTVRVLSVVCILVFVEEFGIKQTTQTVTGVVLIAIQSTLTGILAILIVWNAVNAFCKANPHRKKRKEMEKLQSDDTLTPLDARNSLLLGRTKTADTTSTFETLDNKPYHDEEKALLASRDSTPPLPDLSLIPGPNQRTSTATTVAPGGGPGGLDVSNGTNGGSKLGRIQSGYTMSVYSDYQRSTTPLQFDAAAAAPPVPQQPQQVQQQQQLHGRKGSREQLTASPAPMGMGQPPMNPMTTRQPTIPNVGVGAAGAGYRGMPATQGQGQGPRPARSGSAPGFAPGLVGQRGVGGSGYQMRFQPQRPPRYGAGSQSAGSAVGGYGQQQQQQQRQGSVSSQSGSQGGYYGQEQQQWPQQRKGSQSSQGQPQGGGGPVYSRPQGQLQSRGPGPQYRPQWPSQQDQQQGQYR